MIEKKNPRKIWRKWEKILRGKERGTDRRIARPARRAWRCRRSFREWEGRPWKKKIEIWEEGGGSSGCDRRRRRRRLPGRGVWSYLYADRFGESGRHGKQWSTCRGRWTPLVIDRNPRIRPPLLDLIARWACSLRLNLRWVNLQVLNIRFGLVRLNLS